MRFLLGIEHEENRKVQQKQNKNETEKLTQMLKQDDSYLREGNFMALTKLCIFCLPFSWTARHKLADILK